MKNTLWALLLTLVSFTTTAQVVQNGDFGLIPGIDYEVAGITVSGAQDLDPNVVIMLTNIRVGDNIQFPDPKISDAIRTLWRQQLFENITFSVVNMFTTLKVMFSKSCWRHSVRIASEILGSGNWMLSPTRMLVNIITTFGSKSCAPLTVIPATS